ncbi:MAG TPA: sulfite exporter TauE/SafE family protein [Armatimonadota bacterium]|nr:sulfite exporter TauE/SafE family protein [Armatimonadota bacterium]
MTFSLLQLAALAGVGGAIGYFSGLLGVGGGFMLTPLLIFLFRIPEQVAVGSGMAQMIAVGLGATRRHMAAGFVDVRLFGISAPGVVAGTFMGKWLLAWLVGLGAVTWCGQTFRVAHLVLSALFVLMLGWIAWRCWGEAGGDETASATGRLCWEGGPLPVALPASGLARVSLVALTACGLLIGVMAGLLGVGGGVVLIPLLVFGFGIPLRLAIGTSCAIVMLSAVVVTAQYAASNAISLSLVIALMVGSALGVQVGAWHSHRLAVGRLHRVFAIVAIVVAGIVLLRFIG